MDATDHNRATHPSRRWRRAILLLLLIPFVGGLWVSTYNSVAPALWGIPFFYWYQILWIAISAVITLIVYAVDDSARSRSGEHDRE